MVEDSPDEYVHLLSGKNFWGDSPLGRSILGNPENISRFDADLIKKFFHRLYQPDRIVVSVAGNVEHPSITDRVGPAFESIQPGNGIAERLAPRCQSLVDLNYRELEQVHVCLGAPGLSITDPRRYAYSLLNTILGGNMSSRLFQESEKKEGWPIRCTPLLRPMWIPACLAPISRLIPNGRWKPLNSSSMKYTN